MPHFSWNIDLGQLVTWTIAIGGLVYRFGVLTEAIRGIQATLDEMRVSLREHAGDDNDRFHDMGTTLRDILLKGG